MAPEILKTVPVDFMDGKNLRYRLTDDGHFVLYSVGLDGVDNGGKIGKEFNGFGPRIGINVAETDLVWPRPASAAEISAFEAGEEKEKEEIERRNLLHPRRPGPIFVV